MRIVGMTMVAAAASPRRRAVKTAGRLRAQNSSGPQCSGTSHLDT